MKARELIKSMMLSMMAHPDYNESEHGEFRDYVSMAQDFLDEPAHEYSIDIDGKVLIGLRCDSKPQLIGAVDGGGNSIKHSTIIITDET